MKNIGRVTVKGANAKGYQVGSTVTGTFTGRVKSMELHPDWSDDSMEVAGPSKGEPRKRPDILHVDIEIVSIGQKPKNKKNYL